MEDGHSYSNASLKRLSREKHEYYSYYLRHIYIFIYIYTHVRTSPTPSSLCVNTGFIHPTIIPYKKLTDSNQTKTITWGGVVLVAGVGLWGEVHAV